MKEERMEGNHCLSFHPFSDNILNPGHDCHHVVLSDHRGRPHCFCRIYAVAFQMNTQQADQIMSLHLYRSYV